VSGTIHYHDLLAQTAVRCNALVGTDPVELQVTYSTRPLIDELFDSSIFPMNAIRDAIIDCEGKMAQAISLSANRTLRAHLRALSDPLASGDPLPTQATSKPVIGNLGMIRDADNAHIMTRKPVATVQNYLDAPNIYLLSIYNYALDGATIIHTRDEVVAECCVYDAADQTDAFNANDLILLPDSLAEAYINGAMALLMRDDEWTDQATRYAGYFTTFLATLPPAEMEQAAA